MKKITLTQCKEDKLLILIDNEAQLKYIAKFIPGIHFNNNKAYPGLLRIFTWKPPSTYSKHSDISYVYTHGLPPERLISNIYGNKFNYIKYSDLTLMTKEDKNNILQLIKSI